MAKICPECGKEIENTRCWRCHDCKTRKAGETIPEWVNGNPYEARTKLRLLAKKL